MIVIVEGIDRVGKSTFCKMLEQHGYKLLDAKIHTDKSSVNTEIYDKLQEERTVAQAQVLHLLSKSEKIVIDRFHLSQIVYGYYDRLIDTEDHMLSLEDLLDNAILVYILPTNLSESSKQHGDDLSEHKQYFDKLFCKSKLFKLAGTYATLNDLLNCILEIDNGN